MKSNSTLAIGLVGPLPPPSGGMANQTLQLARLLREAGMGVDVIQVNSPYAPAWVGRMRGVRALFRLVPYAIRLWRSAAAVDLVHVMANSGWAWHLYAAPAIWIARLRGVPVVVNYRGGDAERFMARQSPWVAPTIKRASALVVPSGFLQSIFARFGLRAEIVPNIVDLGLFRPPSSRTKGCHVIVTRNLEEIYDIPTALRAFAAIRSAFPQATLTVAGSGPGRTALETLRDELDLGGSVIFTGRLDNESISELYRTADLLLNPSTVDNMPISLLEAMASAVPIVSTDAGGIPHLVENGRHALLVPPRNPSAMAAAALRVLSDPGLASKLSDAGLAWVERFTWQQVQPLLFATYARALGVESVHYCAP